MNIEHILLVFSLATAVVAQDRVFPFKDGSIPDKPIEPTTELVIRTGNESNQNDGVFGPFTYGLEGSHVFPNGMALKGTFIRLHEPGTPFIASFLDEGQLMLEFPETKIMGQPFLIAGTAWKNRMIDMYTNLGGVEFTYSGKAVSLNAGLYAGTATRDDLSGRFFGAQFGISKSLGPVGLAIDQMNGVIRTLGDPIGLGQGRYSKTALEASMNVNVASKFPVTLTLSGEIRYFDFGNGRPMNDPHDVFILVCGIEINIGDVIKIARSGDPVH